MLAWVVFVLDYFQIAIFQTIPPGNPLPQAFLQQLNSYSLNTNELECAECCFQLPFTYRQHPRYNRNIYVLLAVISGLANSTGGVVLLYEPSKPVASIWNDEIELCLERLRKFIEDKIVLASDCMRFTLMNDADIGHWATVAIKMASSTIHMAKHGPQRATLCFNHSSCCEVIEMRDPDASYHDEIQDNLTVSDNTQRHGMNRGVSRTDSTSTDSHIHAEITQSVLRDIESRLRTYIKLTWTDNRRNWTKHLETVEHSREGSINAMIHSSETLTPTQPLNYTPQTQAFQHLFDSQEQLNRVLQEVERNIGEQRGFCLASQCWASNVEPGPAPRLPPRHLLDLFVCSEGGELTLWEIVTESTDKKAADKQWAYVMNAARLTKRNLLVGPGNAGHDLTIKCFLYDLDANAVRSPKLQSMALAYLHTEDDFVFIQRALATILLKSTSFFQTILGNQYLV